MLEELKILSNRYLDLCNNINMQKWTDEDKEFVKSAIKDAHSIAIEFELNNEEFTNGLETLEQYINDNEESFDYIGPCLQQTFKHILPAYENAMKTASVLDTKFAEICKKDVNPLSLFEYNWMQSAMSNALTRYANTENAKDAINKCKEKFEIYRNENRWLACFNGTGNSLIDDCKKFEQELQINAPKDPKLFWKDSAIKSISSKTVASLSEKELELFKDTYDAYKKAIGIEEDRLLGLPFYSDVDFTFLERNPDSFNISTVDDVINAIKRVYESNIPVVQPMKDANNAKEVVNPLELDESSHWPTVRKLESPLFDPSTGQEVTLPKINAPMPPLWAHELTTCSNVNANMIETNMKNDTTFMQHLRDLLMIPMSELKNKDTNEVLRDLDCKQMWYEDQITNAKTSDAATHYMRQVEKIKDAKKSVSSNVNWMNESNSPISLQHEIQQVTGRSIDTQNRDKIVDIIEDLSKDIAYINARKNEMTVVTLKWGETVKALHSKLLNYSETQFKDFDQLSFPKEETIVATEPVTSTAKQITENASLTTQLMDIANSITKTIFGPTVILNKENAGMIAGVVISALATKVAEDFINRKVHKSLQEGRLKKLLTTGRLKKTGIASWMANREKHKVLKAIPYQVVRATILKLIAKGIEITPGIPDYVKAGAKMQANAVARLGIGLTLVQSSPELAQHLAGFLKGVGANDSIKEILSLPKEQ